MKRVWEYPFFSNHIWICGIDFFSNIVVGEIKLDKSKGQNDNAAVADGDGGMSFSSS